MPKDPFFKFLKLVNFDELTSPGSESSQERSNSEELSWRVDTTTVKKQNPSKIFAKHIDSLASWC